MMNEADRFALERRRMVDVQLRPRGIGDARVLSAFERVPREAFVPPGAREAAYEDHPVAIGEGQTVSQPYIVALMAQELRLETGLRVLEVGTGSGYQTALLAEMGCEVYTIERLPGLADRARRRLEEMGYTGVHFHVGDGTLGWPEEAPFDRITVGAGAPGVPPSLVDQLADGGALIIPVGSELVQELTVVERRDGKTFDRRVCGCVFVPLRGREGW